MVTSNADVVLRTHGLTKMYGKRAAVENLDLDVRRGRVYGFLGPNGSGKTTTIGMALGLISASSGYTEIFGLDTRTHLRQALSRIGAMVEGQAYFPHLSARDNLRVWAKVSGIGDGRIDEVIEQVELKDRARDKVRTYSLGMRQRLAVAAALLHDPELVIFDEPTNGLDPAGIRSFRQLVKELARSGKTVFVSSHILNEVEQMCDDVGILKAGRLLRQTEVKSLSHASSFVELRTTDDARARTVVAALPWVASVTEDHGRIVAEAPGERAAEISRALAANDIYLAEIRARENTLEDFFLDVTGEGAPDA